MRKIFIWALFGFMAVSLVPANAAEISVTSKLDVEVYGYVKLDASYDTQRTSAGDLMFYVLPEKDGKDNEFNMTAKETRLGLNIRVPEAGNAVITGKIETDFYGSSSHNSPNPRLRLGYVDIAFGNTSIRAGQDWETFISVIPRVVNFSYLADTGALGLRRPQVRLTQILDIAEQTKLVAKVAAARSIGQDIDGGGQDDGSAAGFPTIQGNLLLETPILVNQTPARLGVSGHWGQERVAAYTSGDTTSDEKDYDSWSVIGNLILPLCHRQTSRGIMSAAIQGTIWTGENLDTYYGGIGQGVNAAEEQGIRASGGWAQLVLNPMDKVNLNVGYGIDDPKDTDLSKGNRSRNSSIFTSVFVNVLPQVTVAFEYAHMKTEYKDSDNGVNDRFQGAVLYKF